MRKIIATTLVAAATLAGVAASTNSATADPGTPGCVTKAEFNQVRKGMTKATVDAEFGTHGKRESGASSGGYRSEVWSYKACPQFSYVAVSFSANPGGPLKLAAKSGVWSY